jgi:uncharacterized membrane protein YdbT with pleckstrin-like domain
MDERLDIFRSSTLGWLLGTAAGLGTILLAIAGIVLMAMDVQALGIYWLAATFAALVILAVKWVQNLAAKYEVTEERLIIRRGIVMKSVDEIELYRIKDVRINFSLLNQLAGIGNITVSSSDETTRDGDLVIPEISKAQERREHLRRLVDTARQKRRVREIDMVHEDLP